SSASVNPKIGAPVTFDRALLRDVVVIGSDGLLGILGALLLFASWDGLWSILLGAFGAMLPDPSTLFTPTFRMNRCGAFSDFIAGFIPTSRLKKISFWESARR